MSYYNEYIHKVVFEVKIDRNIYFTGEIVYHKISYKFVLPDNAFWILHAVFDEGECRLKMEKQVKYL